jgi:hypothetical protein
VGREISPSALLSDRCSSHSGQPMLVRRGLAAVWSPALEWLVDGSFSRLLCSRAAVQTTAAGACAGLDKPNNLGSQWAILAIFSARLREYLQTWKSFQSFSPNTPRLISFSISPSQGETPKQQLGAGRDRRPCPPSPVARRPSSFPGPHYIHWTRCFASRRLLAAASMLN